MGRTTLKWEDVIQFEEVKGYGQQIWRDGDKLYYVTEGWGIGCLSKFKRLSFIDNIDFFEVSQVF